MKDEIIELMREILYLREDQISEKTKLDDIIQNSMDVIELIAVLSNKYNLTIKPEEMNDITTVADIIEFVKKNHNSSKTTGSLDSF